MSQYDKIYQEKDLSGIWNRMICKRTRPNRKKERKKTCKMK